MNDPLVYSAAIMFGLFSAPHCIGMCGGLVSAMGLGINSNRISHRFVAVLKINFGRLFSYSLLGVLVGLLGSAFHTLFPGIDWVLRIIASVLLMMSGLYIAGWWFALRIGLFGLVDGNDTTESVAGRIIHVLLWARDSACVGGGWFGIDLLCRLAEKTMGPVRCRHGITGVWRLDFVWHFVSGVLSSLWPLEKGVGLMLKSNKR
jgi:hypothetical protein